MLNTKGGCGKTTLATNLASYYASHGFHTAILDSDPQGSSMHWLENRDPSRAKVTGIAGAERNSRVTRTFQMRVPPGIERVIVDTSAALDVARFRDLTRGAHAILVPVLPSDIDIHAVLHCISDLLIAGHVKERANRVAVVANRVRKNTLVYAKLLRFLSSLGIPFIASLRDTQNYVRAAAQGVGVYELDARIAYEDQHDWEPLIDWLENRPEAREVPSLQPTVALALNH
ncbi:MAG: AAA family ATPase [Gammaproteobacteria bacterium]